MFDRALKIDPNDADALTGSAGAYLNEYFNGWTDPQTDYEAKILGQADRAIALAPEQCRGVLRKGPVSRSGVAPIQRSPWRHRRRTRRQPQFRPALYSRARRRKLPRPLRAGQGRRRTGDAAEPARPLYRLISRRRWATQRSASAISTRRSTNIARRSTQAFARFSPTRIWRPPMPMSARWRKRRPPWPKRAVSIPQSRSNG